MDRDELRRFALAVKDEHQWIDGFAQFCEFCEVEYPCNAAQLAEAVLELLDGTEMVVFDFVTGTVTTKAISDEP